ncbi:MAG TPA: ABC transporter permease [Gaiellaceae bacterium]|nr:ABC transporter permease [Gaiellaceae bacterium]
MIVLWLWRWWRRRRGADATTEPEAPTEFRPTPARRGPTAAARGPLALVLHQARYDLLGILRNKQARFFTLILPLLFLAIFVGVFGNHTVPAGGGVHVKASTYYVPGLSALGVIASSFVNLVISITAQREGGILKRRRATPLPAWVLVAGRTLTAVAVSLVVLAVLIVFGRFAFDVRLHTSALSGVVVTAVVGSITFCVLGYALSTAISNEDAAQPMVQAIMLPLYFISGVFVPNLQLPAWLRHVAEVFPVQHLADGLHKAYSPTVHGAGIVWSDLGVLALWCAIGIAVALMRFSWLPKEASG